MCISGEVKKFLMFEVNVNIYYQIKAFISDVGMMQHWLQKNRKLEWVIIGYKRKETRVDKLYSQQ